MSRPIQVRDPLHVFVEVTAAERPVFDCPAFQRLRHIHQLALSYLVYPGATHRRFEHSLGVMELASRIFDVVTDQQNLTDQVRAIVPDDPHRLHYWRQVLRVAALCHDTGHLPFSHAAEKELLPAGTSHESLSETVIRSPQMLQVWKEMKLDADDIVALAVGPTDETPLKPWEAILSEIITSDVFGADRIDYLLRDSLHTGVAYGRFDHHRLIESLRILPPAPTGDSDEESSVEPTLGVTAGGLQPAEALVLARYFMFSQVYLHRVRRIYDIHLKDFLQEWLPDRRFSIDLEAHLPINAAMSAAARDPAMNGHVHAARIAERRHFKTLYKPTASDVERNAAGAKQLYDDAVETFGAAKTAAATSSRCSNATVASSHHRERPTCLAECQRRRATMCSSAPSDTAKPAPG
jgi:HD superfamily phosphohydrolase